MSQFVNFKYDCKGLKDLETARIAVHAVDRVIDCLPRGRDQALAYVKLKECYAWIEKALRDDQIARDEQLTGRDPLEEIRG